MSKVYLAEEPENLYYAIQAMDRNNRCSACTYFYGRSKEECGRCRVQRRELKRSNKKKEV